MSKCLAVVAATEYEIGPLIAYLSRYAELDDFPFFQYRGIKIHLIISGIGVMQTTYALMDFLQGHNPAGWIQAGIGGAVDRNLEMGKTYQISSEMVIGTGAQEQDGSISDAFKMGWLDPDHPPFTDQKLICPFVCSSVPLPLATGMTVPYAHGQEATIDSLRHQHHGQIESMEGAPFFYVSLLKNIPFLSIRSISNMVEPRDKSKWKTDEAIGNINDILIRMIEASTEGVHTLFGKVV